jgi:hypothetical protein
LAAAIIMFNSNNGSKKRKLTDKELSVLEQQRRVAAKLATGKATASSSSAIVSVASQQPPNKPPPSSKQAAILQAKNQTEAIQKVFQTRPSVAAADQKRPAIRSKTAAPPTTVAAALAQARARTKIPSVAGKMCSTVTHPTTTSQLSLTRKTTSHLASLVSASMQTTVDASPSSYGVVDPDDFWKNLRDWDFLSAYVKEAGANKQPRGQQPQGNANNASNTNTSKSLPDTYISHRHYIASWAPLCLAECRAQMLSEALQNTREVFHAVLIETPKNSIGSAVDSVLVICRSIHRGQRSDLQFYANDCVILVPTERVEFVQRCMKEGKDDDGDSMRKYGLLGHAEHTRKGVDGLQLKISKKHWAKAGGADMSILKIGCNITALREFTALCRVESIPLTRHLLGQDLDGRPQAKVTATTKAALLNKMGGTTALGKGFTKYVNSKFNQSQLMAISAAAMEYGQGGFTLIKGPPGTGK